MHTKLPTISFFQNSSFFVAWFSKNSRKRFLNQELHGQLPEKAWSNGLFNFFKIVPFEAPRFFLFKWFHNERKCLLRRVHYQQQSPILSGFSLFKIRKHFHPYFSFSFALSFILFLEASTKFMTTKVSETQIHFMHMLASSNVYIFQKCI